MPQLVVGDNAVMVRRGLGRLSRMSLAGQMLAIQLGIVLVVLVGVAAVSVAQLDAQNHGTAERRATAVAEYVAANRAVRLAVSQLEPNLLGQAQSIVASTKDVSGSTTISLARPDRVVVASSDPLPTAASAPKLLQSTEAFSGRGWSGSAQGSGDALAMAPVFAYDESGGPVRQVGVVAVARAYPSALDNLEAVLPNLLTYLGIASLLGVLGSLLLARRVKRQTLGMEPREITGLVEHREALISGIKEGVVAVDLRGRLTMVNEQAAHLIAVPLTATGSRIEEVTEAPLLADVFDQEAPAVDRVLPVGRRLVTVNRMPVTSRGRQIGWVATLRDRTELLTLQRELDLNRSTTDLLRSQAHEFSNRLHVVNGLVALGEFDEVRSYIREVTTQRTELAASVTERVDEPAVAALLVAKASAARERGVRFVIEPGTALGRLPAGLAADVNTVLGNLVDNAFDAAVAGDGPARVAVEIVDRPEPTRSIVITVRDNGAGVPGPDTQRVFTRGFTTKPTSGDHGRGLGLALVRVVCLGRGGDVEVHNDGGAVFVATLPDQEAA